MASPKTIARLEARIQRRVAHALQFELADPRISFVTVTRVELNTDVSLAKVFYSTLGEAAERTRVQHLLDDATGFVRRQVARVLETRTVPKLRFVFDDTIEEASRMDQLIREARERDLEISSSGEEPLEAPEDAPQGMLEGDREQADQRPTGTSERAPDPPAE